MLKTVSYMSHPNQLSGNISKITQRTVHSYNHHENSKTKLLISESNFLSFGYKSTI